MLIGHDNQRARVTGSNLPILLPTAQIPDLTFLYDPLLGAFELGEASISRNPATYSRVNLLPIVGGQADPRGGTNAFLMLDTNDGGVSLQHFLATNAVDAGGVGCPSTIDISLVGNGWMFIQPGGGVGIYLNAQTGEIGNSVAGCIANLTSSAAGFYSYRVSGIPTAATSIGIQFADSNGVVMYPGVSGRGTMVYLPDRLLLQDLVTGLYDVVGRTRCSQPNSLNCPAHGPLARSEQSIARFDGVNDYLTGRLTGNAAATSHAFWALIDQRATAVTEFLTSTSTGRVDLYNHRAGAVGFFDGAIRTGGAYRIGAQILEWYLDGDAGTADVLRTVGSVTSTVVGGLAYTPAEALGSMQIGAGTGPANHFSGNLATFARLSRVPGTHPAGVASEAERTYMRKYMAIRAAQLGITFAP